MRSRDSIDVPIVVWKWTCDGCPTDWTPTPATVSARGVFVDFTTNQLIVNCDLRPKDWITVNGSDYCPACAATFAAMAEKKNAP